MMRDEDNDNNINSGVSSTTMSPRFQRAVPFSDVDVGTIGHNEVVDNIILGTDNNEQDNNRTTVSEDNKIHIDEETGNIANSEQNNIMQPEIIGDDDAPWWVSDKLLFFSTCFRSHRGIAEWPDGS